MIFDKNLLSHQIFQYIEANQHLTNDSGLLSGRLGLTLFYAHLYKIYGQNQHLTRVYDFIQGSLDTLQKDLVNEGYANPSHGSGYSGFLWLLHHLHDTNIIEETVDDIIDDKIQLLVAKSLENDFKCNNYDPLYGYIGKGIYLLHSQKKHAQDGIDLIIKNLVSSKVIDNNQNFTWADMRDFYQHGGQDRSLITYDCGLAHGVVGIISFCCEMYSKSINQNEILTTLIEKASMWLVSQENKDSNIFKYPLAKLKPEGGKNNYPFFSRLGWCYGDLCIAITFAKAGKILSQNGDHALFNKAHKIAINSTAIKLENSGVLGKKGKIDPSFCHGTCGIAYIYLKLYEEFKDERLLGAYEYWKNITIQRTRQCLENNALFSELSINKEDVGLLYGYTGIGLVSLSFEKNQSFSWDKMLLL